uniref:Uncharacterized protein n=1 Tax=Anguilla anguilla TaxID=7936 RepID=A0A0E9Q1N7_ANGAN
MFSKKRPKSKFSLAAIYLQIHMGK